MKHAIQCGKPFIPEIISKKRICRDLKGKDEEVGHGGKVESLLICCQNHLLLGKFVMYKAIMTSFMQALSLQIFILYIRE